MNYEKILRPLLFKLDPETAHNFAMKAISKGLVKTKIEQNEKLKVKVAEMDWAHPIGLAAGLDKNGEAVNHWHELGFAAAEIGTITHLAQPGNPKPRLFRIPSEKAIINRMGFNNAGAETAAAHLRNAKSGVPLGINLGKSKVTELENAAQDYAQSYQLLREFADYVVINVSSPNTPGLRSLQSIDSLNDILVAMRATSESHPPILIKLAPDLIPEETIDLIGWGKDVKVSGWICSNTTIDRAMLKHDIQQQGGLSGLPLFEKSNQLLELVANHISPEQSLIGVGGIFTGKDVLHKLKLGADAVQIYSGWVYRGPFSMPAILEELLEAMKLENIDSLASLKRR